MLMRLTSRPRLLLISAVTACVLALLGALLTQTETDPEWNHSLWSFSGWRPVAWGLAAICVLSAATSFGFARAYRDSTDPRHRSAALAALAVFALAGALWVAGAFLGISPDSGY